MTPDDVYNLDRPSKGFLCPASANTYGIVFRSFAITDYDSKATIFDTESADDQIEIDESQNFEFDDIGRGIKYKLPEEVLKLPLVATSLTFENGEKPLQDFRMIERHYLGNKLVKTYDFKFAFVIPFSVNTWDSVYETPSFSQQQIDRIVDNPYESKSDTFYFVGEELVMHHKVSYAYTRAIGGENQNDCTESKHFQQDNDVIEEERNYRAEAKEGNDEDAAEMKNRWTKDTGY